MVVSDLSLVRLNSSQVDDSHQAVEATVSRPAKKDLVYTRKPVWKSWKCEGRDNIMPLYIHRLVIYPLTCLGSTDFTVYHINYSSRPPIKISSHFHELARDFKN